MQFDRRQSLKLFMAAAVAAPELAMSSADEAETLRKLIYDLPIRTFDHDGDVDVYAKLRPIYFNAKANGLAFERIAKHYIDSKELWAGETCLAIGYGWWRAESSKTGRLKVARVGQKLAKRLIADRPDHPSGYLWEAVFVGVEALTLGILDSLYLVPAYQHALAQVSKIDATYFYGFSNMLLAKILIKTPRKPLSIGNLDEAIEWLERGRALQQYKVAVWYVFYAEALYLTKGLKPALHMLDAMRAEVRPDNVATAVMLDQSLFDAAYFERVVRENRYNKYTWDPILIPAQPTPAAELRRYGLDVGDTV